MHLDYGLKVDENLSPFSTQSKTGSPTQRSVRLENGLYYNYNARVPGTEQAHKEYAEALYHRINEIVREESEFLVEAWHSEVPYFFNRRAYGMYKNNGACRQLLSNPRELLIPKSYHKKYNPPFFRRSSQRLRNALHIVEVSPDGSTLGIEELSRGRDGVGGGACRDYVQILKTGVAPAPKGPFNPVLDRRMFYANGNFCGISSAYWKKWDRFFQHQVRQAELRMNSRIKQETENLKKSRGRQTRRVYEARPVEEEKIRKDAESSKTPAPRWKKNIKTKG